MRAGRSPLDKSDPLRLSAAAWPRALRSAAFSRRGRPIARPLRELPGPLDVSLRWRTCSFDLDDLVHLLLHLDESVEFAFLFEQFLVGADFDDLAILEYDKPRGVAQRAQTVRDGESGA